MILLELKPLVAKLLPAAVNLDVQALGGLWTLAGYERELANPASELLALSGPGVLAKATQPGAANTAIAQPEHPEETLLGIGGFWSILEEAHIIVLAIHPQVQGRGLGQALLYGLMLAAHQRGLERATLEVRVSNQPALALYAKFGFEKVGRRKRYYPDTQEDGLILWRNGLQKPEFVQTLTDWQQQIQQRLGHSDWGLRSPRSCG